jgi:glutathione S-transferase
MKLHYVVGSPNCRKVHAVLNHLGLSLELEYHDFFSGELQSPEYLALNPNGMVPVLQDGDFTLTESNTIMQYLAEGAGDTPLYARDRRLRADVQRWQCWELARFAPVLDRALATREVLVGEGITLADYSVAHLEGFQAAVPFDWKPFANLNAYFERMRKAPHWAGTAPASPRAIGRRPN